MSAFKKLAVTTLKQPKEQFQVSLERKKHTHTHTLTDGLVGSNFAFKSIKSLALGNAILFRK